MSQHPKSSFHIKFITSQKHERLHHVNRNTRKFMYIASNEVWSKMMLKTSNNQQKLSDSRVLKFIVNSSKAAKFMAHILRLIIQIRMHKQPYGVVMENIQQIVYCFAFNRGWLFHLGPISITNDFVQCTVCTLLLPNQNCIALIKSQRKHNGFRFAINTLWNVMRKQIIMCVHSHFSLARLSSDNNYS